MVRDPRDLPPNYDPRYFYEYASLKRQQEAVGLEGAIYRFIPRSVIASIAFALDPFQQFKSVSLKVTPANRTRRKTSTSVLGARSIHNRKVTSAQEYKIQNTPERWIEGYRTVEEWDTASPSQLALTDISMDTSKSTRPVGSEYGEFSKFRVVEFDSPGRRAFKRDTQDTFYPSVLAPSYWFRWIQIQESSMLGAAALISPNTLDQLRTNEWNRSTVEMQKSALAVYKGILPSNRNYTLARNLVELRDLPRGVLQLKDSLMHLYHTGLSLNIPKTLLERIHSFKINVKDVPKEYLSYCFGWAQLYRDSTSLLTTPDKIGKKIDFLIRRNGKATTYRSSRKKVTTETSTLGFSYSVTPWETSPLTSSILERKTEMKMVVNATFEFPGVDLPSFRRREWQRQIGAIPTPTDLYNLIPWTWLVDWFSGLGDYVQVIDNINSNNELINWGVYTNLTEGTLTSSFSSKSSDTEFHGFAGTPGYTTTINRTNQHTSRLRYSSQVRKNLGTLLSVKATTDLGSLTPYQLSILGALISTRSKSTS